MSLYRVNSMNNTHKTLMKRMLDTFFVVERPPVQQVSVWLNINDAPTDRFVLVRRPVSRRDLKYAIYTAKLGPGPCGAVWRDPYGFLISLPTEYMEIPS